MKCAVAFILWLFPSCLINEIEAMVIRNSERYDRISSIKTQSTNKLSISRRSLLVTSISTSVPLASSTIPYPSIAITPEEASKSYDTYAKNYDELDGGKAASALGIESARIELLKLATGRVLEVI